MMRRVIVVLAGFTLAFGLLMAGPADAQQSPATVLSEQVDRTPQPEVRGEVVSRPLPRTGSDLNGTALFGGALTMVGIGLALEARRRRNAFEGA
jgi:LPXTG-motif cell wall-anchored protein